MQVCQTGCHKHAVNFCLANYSAVLNRSYLVCAWLATVSAWYMLGGRRGEKQISLDGPLWSCHYQSLHTSWSYSPLNSLCTPAAPVQHYPVQMLRIGLKCAHPFSQGAPSMCCLPKISPHEVKREPVGEERTKPIPPTHTTHTHTHTFVLSNLKELLYSYLRRCQGPMACQEQAHFYRRSEEAFWQGLTTLLFLDTALNAVTICLQSREKWQRNNRRVLDSWAVSQADIWTLCYWSDCVSPLQDGLPKHYSHYATSVL